MERVDAPNAGARWRQFFCRYIIFVVHLVCPLVFACFPWDGLNFVRILQPGVRLPMVAISELGSVMRLLTGLSNATGLPSRSQYSVYSTWRRTAWLWSARCRGRLGEFVEFVSNTGVTRVSKRPRCQGHPIPSKNDVTWFVRAMRCVIRLYGFMISHRCRWPMHVHMGQYKNPAFHFCLACPLALRTMHYRPRKR